MVGLTGRCPLSVSTYLVAWKIEIVDDEIHHGFEYVRFEHIITYPTWAAH